MANTSLRSADPVNVIDAAPFPWKTFLYVSLAILAGALAVGGIWIYKIQAHETREEEASKALASAETPEKKLDLIKTYATTDQAPVALLEVARSYYEKKDFTNGLKVNEQFIQQYPSHPLVNSAELNRAANLEALGKLDDAAKAYLDLAQKGKATPYTAYAYISAAKIFASQQKYQEERSALTQLKISGIKSSFDREAALLLTKIPATTPQVSPATTPTSSTAPVMATPAVAPTNAPAPAPTK